MKTATPIRTSIFDLQIPEKNEKNVDNVANKIRTAIIILTHSIHSNHQDEGGTKIRQVENQFNV